jgi:S-adenosylmethionine:tRNA ribosyltransferase-isomerase
MSNIENPINTYPIELLDYDLPTELIAQVPLANRSASRMLHINRSTSEIKSKTFLELPELLKEGDVLVLNDSRVINGRIRGRKLTGGAVEILVLKEFDNFRFEVLAEVRGGMKQDDEYLLDNDFLVRVVQDYDDGTGLIQAISILPDDHNSEDFTLESMVSITDLYAEEFIQRFYRTGKVPTPPYIRTQLDEPERYQTIYACALGSAAAPTAGLHFTDEVLKAIENKGVEIHKVTLHVGIGTFLPIRANDLSNVKMHKEEFRLSVETARGIARARAENRRIIAVGTTSARVLETIFIENNLDDNGVPVKLSGDSDIFIYPGYKWRIVGAMLTNFHLPCSTLLAMIYSFGGSDLIKCGYERAVNERYRFYSFGDCMFIE